MEKGFNMLNCRMGGVASRLLLSLAACVCCLGVFTSTAHAATARETLERSVTAILDCIKDPAYANAATRPAQREKIAGLVRQIFDFQEFAIRTAGPRWNICGPTRKVEYTGEVGNKEQTRMEVRTVVTLGDGKKVPVSYRMMLKNGAWRCYDVLIENLSLVMNYRTQFQDILAKDAPDELITRVQAKAKEAAANAK